MAWSLVRQAASYMCRDIYILLLCIWRTFLGDCVSEATKPTEVSLFLRLSPSRACIITITSGCNQVNEAEKTVAPASQDKAV